MAYLFQRFHKLGLSACYAIKLGQLLVNNFTQQ